MLHDAMAFLAEGCRRMVRQYVEQNLLSPNNDGTYNSTGGVGYTDELPLPDHDPERIRPCDMWASAEEQEMAQVSPEHHAEFCLTYERPLLEPFGLTGYGITKGSALGAVLTLAASLAVGVFTLWLVAKAFAVMKGLQSSGTTSLQTAAGEEGVVYLSIPAGGTGKVQVKVGQHLRVVDATSEDKEDIHTGERVVVEYTLDGLTLVVRRA